VKTRIHRHIILLVVIISLGYFNVNQSFAQNYVISDLGTLSGTKSEAWGINNNDAVVGRAFLAGDSVYHAFLYGGVMLTDLGIGSCTNPSGHSFAFRINDSGQIAGVSCMAVAGNLDRAFIYDGVMKDLGTLGGTQSEARGINNSGHVVGTAAIALDAAAHAFIYSGGVMTDLGTLGGSWSWAYGINDSDQVVGSARFSTAAVGHAFLYKDGVMTDLTPDPNISSAAYDINNSGQVVGTSFFPGTDSHAFRYSAGVIKDLGVLSPGYGAYGTGISEAWAINNRGQIVGWSYSLSGIPHAFIYDYEVITDLNDLLPPGSGWVLNYAYDINDNGRIVGIGTINGQSHAFLMVPPTVPKIRDFSGDNKSDLIWQSQATGQLAYWLMNGVALQGFGSLFNNQAIDTNWKIVGIGDFNADGKPDFIWHSQVTGQVSYWLMNGLTLQSYGTLNNGLPNDPRWKIVCIGDFDGNGSPDIIWQSQATGQLAYWLMSGVNLLSFGSLFNNQAIDTNWKIVGCGDFNGDGKPDFIWHSQVTGQVRYWLMNGLTLQSFGALNNDLPNNPSWKIVGVFDLDNDGQTDLIWQSQVTGQLYYWLMNGVTLQSHGYLFNGQAIDTNWKIVGK
jgi:probable HAF family extracellular repeat protein